MKARTATIAAMISTLLLTSEVGAQRGTIPVNIESTPPGATVYLDQEADANRIGVTPMRNVRVPRGNHTLIFVLNGHETLRQAVYFRRRRETFRATLNALSVIDLQAGNSAAAGAAVRIDGQPVGNIPHRQTVQPGRHLVQVGREGYVTFNQWVDVAGAQVLTLPVILEAQAPSTGSLLVAGDVSGAAIYVDGTPRGSTPTVIDGLTEGEHTIEVRANDPSLQPFRQTVRIVAGERLTLSPTLRPAPPAGGSLRVLTNVRGAVVSVDGEVIGEAPATAENLPPGEHIVEARAEGYEPAQQPVTIEAGRQRVVSVQLQPQQRAPGRIVVNADAEGAVVFIDGEERGAPPVVLEGASSGTHAILVRAPGHREYRETCTVGPGQNCEITARLEPVGTPVRVEANVQGAEFVVDGEVMGPVPWEGTLPIGSHRIEVRAPGYRSYTAQVALRPSREPRLFNVGLVGEDELTPEERRERETERRERHRQAVSRSGATLPNDLAVLDFSAGWPHLFEFRLGIGIFDWLEAGVGLRTTFYRLTEFEGRVKAGYRPIRQISLGAQFRLGGGLGPAREATEQEITDLEASGDWDASMPVPEHATNTFFFSLEGLFSLHFLNAGNFTLWLALDYHTDKWVWNGRDNDCRRASGCQPPGDTLVDGADDMARLSGRQRVARLRLGGSLEFILSNRWNTWASFEGILAGGPRRIFGDMWGFGKNDVQLYARLGFTYKFGYVERD